MKTAVNLAAVTSVDHEPDHIISPVVQLSDEEKIARIQYHFYEIIETLGLDMNDDSLKQTPFRIAKMYVEEIFSGLDAQNYPAISLFDNTYGYHEMLIEKNIKLFSCCQHHFLPIIGKVHCAYFPREKVIGLSKINRLVQYFSRRPQEQDKLTLEIADGLKDALRTEDVAVCIQAEHLCVSARGVGDYSSAAVTHHFGGQFKIQMNREAFFDYIFLNENK